MKFTDLFNSYSRRSPARPKQPKPLTSSFRNRVLMRCKDLLEERGKLREFWVEIYSKFAYLIGSPKLTKYGHLDEIEDVLAFVLECSDDNFLDFVEFIFRTDACFVIPSRDEFVEDINDFLREDKLPYNLTKFVWTTANEDFHGSMRGTTRLTAFPRVIRKDSEVVHRVAIDPTLNLLQDDAAYSGANTEFLDALEDYRKGDYGDCLTKCGSALESVLKVICDQKSWHYSATDTASPLLKTVIERSGLESFFEQPLILVATLRNRLSKAHGSGTKPREVTQHKAEYAINATAAAILLLVKHSS